MPPTPDPQLHALWRERVRRQVQSGLTIAQFCAQERLPAKLFYAWRSRLQRVGRPDHRSVTPAPATFLPVTVRLAERTPHEPLPIEADLPNGVRLRIPTSNARLACCVVRAVAAARTDSGGSR
jgi:hypothetical protein